MREIKFRGLTNNGWVYGDLIHDLPNETLYYQTHPCRIAWHEGLARCNQPIKKETEGQFTDLKDRSGKEIYEGDIVKHIFAEVHNPFHSQDQKFVCEWKEERYEICHNGFQSAGWKFTPLFKGLSTVFVPEKDLEIIGNIYENPELLNS